jgi:TRAP-type C4-dicarboxylate transport system permease large subunit
MSIVSVRESARITPRQSFQCTRQGRATVERRPYLGFTAWPTSVPHAIPNALADREPWLILLFINLVLLIVGTFMDMTPAVLIFTPIFLPVAVQLGITPLHFGIMMVLNLCIGLCTPPVGSILFVGCGIWKTTVPDVTRALLPFYAVMVLALLLVVYLPWLSDALPRLLGYTL